MEINKLRVGMRIGSIPSHQCGISTGITTPNLLISIIADAINWVPTVLRAFRADYAPFLKR
jgi:hypothetical protein